MNLLANSEFLVFTGSTFITKQKQDGSGDQNSVSVSSYTTGSNEVICYTSDTKQLKVNDLVAFSVAANLPLKITSCRVISIVPNTSFTVRCPLGLKPTTSVSCTATPITAGNVLSGVNIANDGYYTTGNGMLWRDDFTANVYPNHRFDLGIRKSDNNPLCYFFIFGNDPGGFVRRPYINQLKHLLDRTIYVGMGVKQSLKNGSGTAKVFIQTDSGVTYSTASTGSGSYEWLEVSETIPSNATYVFVGIELEGSTNDVYYLTMPTCDYNSIGSFNYVPRFGEAIHLYQKLSPISYISASFTFPSTKDATGVFNSIAMDLYAESNGAFAPGITAVTMLLEGQSDATNNNAFAVRNVETVAEGIIYGPAMYNLVASNQGSGPTYKVNTCGGKCFVDSEARMLVYSTGINSWYGVNFDIVEAYV